MKLVLSKCYGGFSLSEEACKKLFALGVKEFEDDYWEDIDRNNEHLIAIVEKDAESASGSCANLEIVEIPNNATDWMIDEYDGWETVIYVVDGKLYRK